MIISANEIHVWYAYDDQIHDPSLLSQYHNILTQEQRVQQKRFYFEKGRHQYLITRAMVKSVLSLYVNEIAPENWEFEKNEYGKPFISNSPLAIPLHFNISHSDKLIVMAVTLEQEIGVDVEYLPRPGNMLDIASNFFSPTEVEHLFALPPENRVDRFFDLWTLKEAYIKACGMGLSIPLDHFTYTFPRRGEVSISFAPERDDQPEYWQFWQFLPNDTHKVALALKSKEVNDSHSIIKRTIVPLSDITEVNYPVVMKTSSSKWKNKEAPANIIN